MAHPYFTLLWTIGQYGAQAERCQTVGGGNDATFAFQIVQLKKILNIVRLMLDGNNKVDVKCVM